jgi:hypothetical protein
MGLLRLNSFDASRHCSGCVLRPAMLAVLVCVAYSAMTAAQSGAPTEYQVKAAFLFNFTKFVEWPATAFADPRAPIVLGVLGEDPFGRSLNLIVDGQFVRGRGITIRNYHFGDDLRGCQVLYVSASEQARTAQILGGLQRASMLTVSDMPNFAGEGGVVQFYMEEDRVRFVVNVDAAARANLRVSAKLLAVAHVINDVRGVR